MTEQNTKRIQSGIIAAILLGALGTGLGVSQWLKGQELLKELADVKAIVYDKQNEQMLSFKNKSDFEAAVAESIEKFVTQKQQADMDQKYVQYKAAPEKVEDGKHIYGNAGARFTLVEFSDLECPFCKQFHDTPKQIVDASNGNVNWQWKHLPLEFHNPAAYKEALAAECIAEQKGNRGFWVFIHDVFQQSQGNGRGVKDLGSLVTGAGADLNLFRECLSSNKYESKVQADIEKAKSYGVNGTPATFVVDNQTGKSQLLGGAQPAEAIMAAIRKMMVESEQEKP